MDCEVSRVLAGASTERAFSKMNVSVFSRMGAPAEVARIRNEVSNRNTVILSKF